MFEQNIMCPWCRKTQDISLVCETQINICTNCNELIKLTSFMSTFEEKYEKSEVDEIDFTFR